MNSSDRRHLIFLKASANEQRRNRDALLKSLTPALLGTLRTAPCIYTPESHLVIARFLPITTSGVGSGTQTRPANYSFIEVASSQKVFTLVQQVSGINPSTGCYLSIASVSGVYQGEQGYWIPKYPVFVVEFGWVQSVLSDLWSIADNRLAVVGCNLEFGMIIDHYCGYLEDDYNADEIVYECARWSNAA